MLEKILDKGRVARGFIGVVLGDISTEFFVEREEFSAYVRSVLKNTPADHADVRPGDIILSIADLKIKNSKHFLTTVSRLEPSSKTNLKLKRGEKIIDMQISVAERPKLN